MYVHRVLQSGNVKIFIPHKLGVMKLMVKLLLHHNNNKIANSLLINLHISLRYPDPNFFSNWALFGMCWYLSTVSDVSFGNMLS